MSAKKKTANLHKIKPLHLPSGPFLKETGVDPVQESQEADELEYSFHLTALIEEEIALLLIHVAGQLKHSRHFRWPIFL